MKVELDSSNYTTKADLKNAIDVDKLKFAKMVDLASLRSNQGFIETLKLMSALLKEPQNLYQFITNLFFLANIPTHGRVENNLTPSCLFSW